VDGDLQVSTGATLLPCVQPRASSTTLLRPSGALPPWKGASVYLIVDWLLFRISPWYIARGLVASKTASL
jgi:hypothetical protein